VEFMFIVWVKPTPPYGHPSQEGMCELRVLSLGFACSPSEDAAHPFNPLLGGVGGPGVNHHARAAISAARPGWVRREEVYRVWVSWFE
jgi:hypothetical protein